MSTGSSFSVNYLEDEEDTTHETKVTIDGLTEYIETIFGVVKEKKVTELLYRIDEHFRILDQSTESTTCSLIYDISNCTPFAHLCCMPLSSDLRQGYLLGSLPIPLVYKVPPQKGFFTIQRGNYADLYPCMTYSKNIKYIRNERVRSPIRLRNERDVSVDDIDLHLSKEPLVTIFQDPNYTYIPPVNRWGYPTHSSVWDSVLYFENTTGEEGEIYIYVSMLNRTNIEIDEEKFPSQLSEVMETVLQTPSPEQIKRKKKVVDFVTERAEAFTIFSDNSEVRAYWKHQYRLEGLEEFNENTKGLWLA